MLGWQQRIALVQAVSILRLAAAILFAALAFQEIEPLILVSIYCFAATTDIIDGSLARRLNVSSQTGLIIDLISDKSLTVVSVLYAAARGIDFLPLALIAVRELVILGFRAIQLNGKHILSTSKLFGGVMALMIWSNTVVLIVLHKNSQYEYIIGLMYWICAMTFIINLAHRLFNAKEKIVETLK